MTPPPLSGTGLREREREVYYNNDRMHAKTSSNETTGLNVRAGGVVWGGFQVTTMYHLNPRCF